MHSTTCGQRPVPLGSGSRRDTGRREVLERSTPRQGDELTQSAVVERPSSVGGWVLSPLGGAGGSRGILLVSPLRDAQGEAIAACVGSRRLSMRAPYVVQDLDQAECRRLIETVPVGRIASTDRGLPKIVPVHCRVHGNELVIGSIQAHHAIRMLHGDVVAFEADSYDPARREGWCVGVI